LPESLGDSAVPVDGPLNVLDIRDGARDHKVVLNDPAGARGEQAGRFRIVWNAIAALSPVKPPF